VKRPAVIVAAATGLFALGFVASGVLTRAPTRDPSPSTPAVQGGPQPSGGPASGAAQVQDRTEHGARTTAIAFATASQDWLYMNDQQIDRAVRAIATASAAASLSSETVAELRTARDALAKSPGRVWWLVRPLASRVEHFDPAAARIVVWTVTVLSAAGVALPQADWVRVTVDLTWERDSWRLQAINDVPGPTPMTSTKDRPWQAEPFDTALAGFERVSSEGNR
jgi:hypothetical protein